MNELYRKLLEFTGDGVHCYTVDEGRILMANRGFVRILDLDVPPEAVVGRTLTEIMVYVEAPGTIRRALEKTGEIHNFEYHFKTLKGEERWVLHDSFLATDPGSGKKIVQAIIRDITPFKRTEQRLEALVRLYEMSDALPEAIAQFALEEGVRLTVSQFGCLGFLDEKEVALTIRHWSREAPAECRLENKSTAIPLQEGTWWAQAAQQRTPVIVNDCSSFPRLRQSHPFLVRFMSLPVFDGSRLVAVVTVANKNPPYDEADKRQLSLLMTGMWQLLRRRHIEEQLRQHQTHLELLVSQRTSELAHSNAALQMQINEYARIEKALRESEERFRLAMTSAPLALFHHDRSLRYTWFHYPKAPFPTRDFIGKTDAELLPTEEAAQWTAFKSGVLTTGTGARAELPFTHLGITYFFDLTVEPLRDAQNKIAGLTGIALDVTERRRAEQAARREAELLRLTHDAIFVCDMEGRIQFWNRGAEETYGWQQNEVIGRTAQQLLGTHFPKPLDQITEELLQTGRWEGELEQLTRNGEHVVVASRWVLVRDEQGRPTGTLRINNDITERKRMEENLRLSNAELEQFAYAASHDLKEPLRSIYGFLELLRHRYEGKLGPDADEYINYAVDGALRMRKLIDNLLEYSRVGRRDQSPSPVDCAVILKTVITNLQPDLVEKHGRITWDPLPTVMGNPVELSQLFQNLIANAIKFHGPQPPEIHVGAVLQGREWRFHVRDNGIGIHPKDFDRIFVIFQRLHSRDEYPGTGIGLSLCKKIVERHGGRIWVESEPGKGSTFFFTLPVIGEASP